MRFKGIFSLYRRKIGNGKVVYYYQCYDSDGRRMCGQSTGQTSKTAANAYCIQLFKDNALLKKRSAKLPTFKEFADGFWDLEKSAYLKSVKARQEISKSYPDIGLGVTNNHLIPKYGNLRLDEITDQMVDKWLLSYPANGFSNNTGNHSFKFLSLMLNWAVKEKLISVNPCKNVKLLKEQEKERDLLDLEDIKKLFGDDWKDYWGKYIYCLVNKLAACTGMRLGELVGLKWECVMDKHILVMEQFGKYGQTDTKNHKARNIPISSKIADELNAFREVNGVGYLFSKDGGETPISRKSVTDAFTSALGKLGIDRKTQKKRGLSFHSWRHFFNTSLLLADVPAFKVREMTGHLSRRMTNKYTHIKIGHLEEITAVQDNLLTAK